MESTSVFKLKELIIFHDFLGKQYSELSTQYVILIILFTSLFRSISPLQNVDAGVTDV